MSAQRHPRIHVFLGRFGSGKTEAAINFAVRLAQGWRLTDDGWRLDGQGSRPRPFLIDLDIVTPYFRSRETVSEMAAVGVDVIEPSHESRHLDMPAISPEILGAVEQSLRPVVVDLGGDPQGARALGQYSAAITRDGYESFFVVNPFRPFTASVPGIRQSLTSVEATARLRATALVSNPNLMSLTTRGDVVRGHWVVREAAAALGLPVALLCLHEGATFLSEQWEDGTPVLPIHRYMQLDWFDA